MNQIQKAGRAVAARLRFIGERVVDIWYGASRASLTSLVDSEAQAFPQSLISARRHYSRLWRRPSPVQLAFPIVGAFLVLGVIAGELLVAAGYLWPFALSISQDGLVSLLDTVIGGLAALIGIGIPIVFFVIESVATKKAEFLLRPMLDRSGVVWAALVILATLTLAFLARYVVAVYSEFDATVYLVVATAAALGAIVSLIEIIYVVVWIHLLFDPRRLNEIFETAYNNEVWRQTREQVFTHLGDIACAERFQVAGLQRYDGIQRLRGYAPVKWIRSGRLAEIRLGQVERVLTDKALFGPSYRQGPLGYYLVGSFQPVQEGQIAFYLRMPEELVVPIARRLLAAFDIQPSRESYADLKPLLDWLKERILSALHNDSGEEFVYCLGFYSKSLATSFWLPALPETGDFITDFARNSTASWNLSHQAIRDLRAIAHASANVKRDVYIRQVAWTLVRTMEAGNQAGVHDHTGDMAAIQAFYFEVYEFSLRAGKSEATQTIRDALFKSFLQQYTFWVIHNAEPTLQQFVRRQRIYLSTLRISVIMLKACIEQGNVDEVVSLLRILEPTELGIDYAPIALWHPPQPKGVVEFHESYDRFRHSARVYIYSIRFATRAFVAEGVGLNIITGETGRSMLEPLIQESGDIRTLTEQTLQSLENVVDDPNAILDWTRNTTTPDHGKKHLYFYGVRAVQLLLQEPQSDQANPLDVRELAQGMSGILLDMLNQWQDKWAVVTGVDMQTAKTRAGWLQAYLDEQSRAYTARQRQ